MTKTRKPEKTSARVARIAGRVLAADVATNLELEVWVKDRKGGRKLRLLWSDIRALAASALTQAEDKPKLTPVQIVKAAYRRLTPKPRRRARRKRCN